MKLDRFRSRRTGALAWGVLALCTPAAMAQGIGDEISVPEHLDDGEEFTLPLRQLLQHGDDLFQANWTVQEGGGRPLTKGTGAAVVDPSDPLVFPRNFNRVSAMDANSCFGCHNAPFGVSGGGGDFVTGVFVLGHRFDFATLDHNDPIATKGAVDEKGDFVTLDDVANYRATLGMFGSGYIEALARQMTADLQAIRDSIALGGSAALTSKGISFGTLTRNADDSWDTSAVEGLPAPSLASSPGSPPNLLIRPFHQAGAVVTLRQFTNNAMNHHHGIQPVERFGTGDPDGDGFMDEMTIADVSAATLFQAAMAVPGRVIPRDQAFEDAIERGEDLFVEIGCASCHTPCLTLDKQGWVFTEPSPFSPAGNLQLDDDYVQTYGVFSLNLARKSLPPPRLPVVQGRVEVPAFTDLKLHDITSGPDDPNREPLDMQEAAGSDGFFAGNSKFITRKLWGTANEPPYFHHGKYTTLRQAVEAHAGEADPVMANYFGLSDADQDNVVEFLKTLQVLPPGTTSLVVDERGNPRNWRDFPWDCE